MPTPGILFSLLLQTVFLLMRALLPFSHACSLLRLLSDDAGLLVVLLTTFKYSRYLIAPKAGSVHVLLHQVGLRRSRTKQGEAIGQCCL